MKHRQSSEMLPCALIAFLTSALLGQTSAENFVHLMEWRFDDIANECEFLGKNGYTGVQVSPVMESPMIAGRPWWERYQAMSYKIVSRSGDAADFKRMTDTCSKFGVKIIVDVLFNHMTATLSNSIKGINGSEADSQNKNYPAVPYTAEHFHPTCAIQNYQNATEVRVCELVSLHDLDQKQEYVRGKLIDHLNELIDLGAGGFRIDAGKHMYPEDIEIILNRTKPLPNGEKPFIFLEVPNDTGPEAIHSSEYFNCGRVTEFRFHTYLRTHVDNLASWTELVPGDQLVDSIHAVVFTDNHDRQRDFPFNYKDPIRYTLANAFMLSWPYGVKKVMSSFWFDHKDDGPPHNEDFTIKNVPIVDGKCGNGWICEHRWPEIAAMARFSQDVEGTDASNIVKYSEKTISFHRTGKGFVLLSYGTPKLPPTVQTGLPAGKYCDVISGHVLDGKCTGLTIDVDEQGNASLALPERNYTIVALHVGAVVN